MSLRDEVYDAEKSALNGEMILKLLQGIAEPRIHRIPPSDPTEAFLFGNSDCAAVLTKGHWMAFLKHQGKTLFFDSFGRNLKRAIPSMAKFADSKKVHSSTSKIQQDKADVATCGFHCVCRIWKNQ